MKLKMIRSLIAFALFSNTAFASQSAVDYLSTQGIGMFDFGMFRLSNSHNKRIDILKADFNIKAMGAAYFDDGKERLVLSTMIFDLGDFKQGTYIYSRIWRKCLIASLTHFAKIIEVLSVPITNRQINIWKHCYIPNTINDVAEAWCALDLKLNDTSANFASLTVVPKTHLSCRELPRN